MARLKLTVAGGHWDRARALADGTVSAEGMDLDYRGMHVTEFFRRMVEGREFHASELGLTYYLRTLALDDPPFIAIPVFPVRFFRHASVFINTASGIDSPADLAGKALGEVFVFGHDAGVWMKGILRDEYGLRLETAQHYVGEMNEYGPKWDWLPGNPPAGARVEQLGPGRTLNALLESGEIAACFSAMTPRSLLEGSAQVRRLFTDYPAVERDYFRRTGIFPIMHTFVIRRDVHRQHPWVARSLYQALKEARDKVYKQLKTADEYMHSSMMMPWFSALRDENRRLLGEDFWPYGFRSNHHTVDTFLRYHHEQGLTRRYTPEEIFCPETLDT